MDQTVLPCVFMVCFWIGKSNKSQITFHSSCRGTWKPTANFIEPSVLYPFQVPQHEGKVSQDSRIWPAYEHGETAEGSSLESPSDVCVCLRRARCSDAGVWEAAWPQGSGCLFQAVGEIMGQILSLFLHLVGKCGRNSPPKSRWVLRSITTLGTVAVWGTIRGGTGILKCRPLMNIAASCVTGRDPLPPFSHLCKVSNNTDLSPDMVENELASISKVNWNGNVTYYWCYQSVLVIRMCSEHYIKI